jgi:hypothetical protein
VNAPNDLPDGLLPGDLVMWTDPDTGAVRCREVIAVDERGSPLLGPERVPPP